MVFTTRGPKLGDPVSSCSLSVEEDLTGEQASIRFLVLKVLVLISALVCFINCV